MLEFSDHEGKFNVHCFTLSDPTLYRQRIPFYLMVEPGREWLQLCINQAGHEVESIELCEHDQRIISLPSGRKLEIQPRLLLGR